MNFIVVKANSACPFQFNFSVFKMSEVFGNKYYKFPNCRHWCIICLFQHILVKERVINSYMLISQTVIRQSSGPGCSKHR